MTMPHALSRYAGWGLLLALLIPVLLYWVLPTVGVTALAHKFSLPWLLSTVNMLVFGTLFGYLAYLSASRYLIIPVVAFFLYQMAETLVPILHLPNYLRTLYMLYSLVLIGVGVFRFRFNPLMKPLMPFFLFVAMNVLFVLAGHMVAPNYLYMPEFYGDKPNRFLPVSYGQNWTIFLGFVAVAVYITFNAFLYNVGNVRKWFKYFVVFFLLGYSLFSIGAYFANDIRFMNILAGVRRLSGLNGHTNIFAFFLNSMMIYIFSFLYTPHRPDQHPPRVWTLTALAAGVLAVFLTFSRSNLGALILLVLVNNTLLSKNRAKSILNSVLLIAGVAVILGLVQASGAFDVMGMIANRMEDDASSNYRPITWSYVLSQIQFDWQLFLGHGIGAVGSILNNLYSTRYFVGTPIVYQPHNTYLQLLFDYGIVGLVLYMAFIIRCLPTAVKNLSLHAQVDVPRLMLLEMVVVAMITSFTDAFLFCTQVAPFWILLVALYTEATTEVPREIATA